MELVGLFEAIFATYSNKEALAIGKVTILDLNDLVIAKVAQ